MTSSASTADLYRRPHVRPADRLAGIPAWSKKPTATSGYQVGACATGFDAVCPPRRSVERPSGRPDPQLTFDINHRASVRLAGLAKEAGVRRFVFSSSCSNYGARRRRHARRAVGFQPRHALRAVEGLRRT